MSSSYMDWRKPRRTEKNSRTEDRNANLLAVLKNKVTERDIPPRLVEWVDSRGQPISLPKLRFMGEAP